MDPFPKTDLSPLQQIQRCMEEGAVAFVDEDGQALTLAEAYLAPSWAHLRDVVDGQTYVHRIPDASELLRPQYRELLGINV